MGHHRVEISQVLCFLLPFPGFLTVVSHDGEDGKQKDTEYDEDEEVDVLAGEGEEAESQVVVTLVVLCRLKIHGN